MKLIVTQLVKKFSALYRTRVITVFITYYAYANPRFLWGMSLLQIFWGGGKKMRPTNIFSN
jgi:hypothetical protein